MLDMISVFLFTEVWFVTQDVVWPGECSMCTWEEGIFFCIEWNVLKISMRSISSNVSFKTCVSFLIFYFDKLSIGVGGVLKSPTIIVLLSISPFMSVSVCLTYWGAPMLDAQIFTIVVFLSDWSPDHFVVSFLISCNLLYFKVYFVWYEDCYSSFLLLPIFMEYIFPSSHFQFICVFRSEVDFL